MDNLVQIVAEVPPVSRYWSVSIIFSTVGSVMNVVSPKRLVFVPDRAFSTQPWRLFTAFCYFGEPSIPVALAIWTTIRYSRVLEEAFRTPMALFPQKIHKFNDTQLEMLSKTITRFRSVDYFYFVLLVCISIVFMTSLGFYWLRYSVPMLGFILHEVLTYISCRLYPDQQANIFGLLTFQGASIPIFTAILELVIQPDFKQDLVSLMDGDAKSLWKMVTSPMAWKAYLCLSLGHFWWFVSFYLFNQFYSDQNPERLRLTTQTVRRVEQSDKLGNIDIIRYWSKLVLLPPWYWVIVSNIENRRGRFR